MRSRSISPRCLGAGLLAWWAACLLPGPGLLVSRADEPSPSLRITELDGRKRVEILARGEALLQSPEEGLWSIATDWEEGWPTRWQHASPRDAERIGPWTVLRGELSAERGTWAVSDSYRPEGHLLRCVRRWTWKGAERTSPTTLSVRWQAPRTGTGVVMPGILYHGNPSGARSGRVPVFGGAPGEEAIFEEHRFPMPFVSFEWARGADRRGAALHVLPAPVAYAHLEDQWWSLGATAKQRCTELVLLSGPCASNGRRSVIKAVQQGFVPYGDAYLEMPPGAIVEKTFWLEAYPVSREGAGFQRPVRSSLALFDPYGLEGFPSFREIIQAKYRFSKSRWYEKEDVAGYRKYPDRNILVLGWCGQAAALGYALPVLADLFEDELALSRAQKTLDFLSGAEFYDGGFRTWYHCDTGIWDHHEPLSQGQAMLHFARAIRNGRSRGLATSRWESFLRRACELHAATILADDWRPRSTDLAFLVAPLCQAYELFGVEKFREAAEKAGETYAARHLSMREPYWGGTLDAQCEDKEGAFAALQAFLALYETTREARYLDWAQHACDVALTYVVIWDIDLPPGRLRDHAFKTRGWTVVSPQNQHIDVFGVLIAPDVYRVGQLTQRSELERLALVMYRSCGQLIDPLGSQGEQPQHTNYAQRGRVDDVFALRGGYVEDWTVFWITAHFLNAAARFRELGVSVWD